ncbi:MAG: putative sulfate exporter family transporter [Synechococcaceae cyanobacterium SM2_3_1]|nr:putative sulfate exporter family transporter [Synechococcaceae cyanobacterium SM2_3_1]
MIWKLPHAKFRRRLSSILLQVCVVGLGFNMNLVEILRVGSTGILYTASSLIGVLIMGLWLGKIFKVHRRNSFLITVGTAICGGSAIAAVGPVIDAQEEEMSVSLGTVFLLNAVALLLFPWIGTLAGLNEPQFGLWSALAIHDTSSVVAAGARYGTVALTVGTTIKLARALWIIPLCLGIAVIERQDQPRLKWPWFIGFYLCAALFNSLFPAGRPLFEGVYTLSRLGLTATLFLIGSGITRQSLEKIGVKPLLQGITLWVAVSLVSLLMIQHSLLPVPVLD